LAQQPQLLLRSPAKLVERLRLLGLGGLREAAAAVASDAQLAALGVDSVRGVGSAVLAELREVHRGEAAHGGGGEGGAEGDAEGAGRR
jgi:hypothetical protein